MSVETGLKAVLRTRGAFGPMIFESFSPGIPAIVAASGSDFVLFDMEHTGTGFETIKQMLAACRGLPLTPLVRVPAAEYHFVARALDMGAHGIMVPMVDSAAEAERIVRFAHYPPRGRRGAAFGAAHDHYRTGDPVRTMADARARTLVIAQIETPSGLEEVEKIAAIDGIDVVWVGHFDLTNFMGIPGEFENETYLAALRRVVAAAEAHGKQAGFLAPDAQWGRRYWELGFRMLGFGPDQALLRTAMTREVEALGQLRKARAQV